jgi:Vitamin K-dependent gamma-carboxylase
MAHRISNIIKQWNIFWGAAVEPHALAIARIGFGLFLLAYWLGFSGNVPELFSNEGVIFTYYNSSHWFLYPPSAVIAYGIYAVSIACILLFIAGAYWRCTTTTLVILAWYYWQLQLHMFFNSYSRLLFELLIVFALSNAHYTYSFFAKQRWGSFTAWKQICILWQRMITLQITATYFAVSWQKIILPDWETGDVLVYTLVSIWSTPLSIWLAQLPLTHTAWNLVLRLFLYWETLLPFGLWHKKTRVFWIITAILFHLFNGVIITIWWFYFLFPFYILFYSPSEVYAFTQHVGKRRRKIAQVA